MVAKEVILNLFNELTSSIGVIHYVGSEAIDDSVTREAVFAIAINRNSEEEIIDKIYNAQLFTDEGVKFIKDEVGKQGNIETRYAFFSANINTNKNTEEY